MTDSFYDLAVVSACLHLVSFRTKKTNRSNQGKGALRVYVRPRVMQLESRSKRWGCACQLPHTSSKPFLSRSVLNVGSSRPSVLPSPGARCCWAQGFDGYFY